MRLSFWQFRTKAFRLRNNVALLSGPGVLDRPKILFQQFLQTNGPLLFRNLASYIHMRILAIADISTYNFYRSPGVLNKTQFGTAPQMVKPIAIPARPYHNRSPRTVRKSPHNVYYWDQRPKVQYDSVNGPSPFDRPSTTGRVVYMFQIAAPIQKHASNKPNIEIHTWSAVEPTQYGHSTMSRGQAAAQVRAISMRQLNSMHLVKKYN